ncbi:MAG: hypothetical protein AB7U75_14970 [Hyphomicrobiaceae bacterium]
MISEFLRTWVMIITVITNSDSTTMKIDEVTRSACLSAAKSYASLRIDPDYIAVRVTCFDRHSGEVLTWKDAK